MTISSTTVKNSYSGNGTLDTFNYTFKIFADADIQVIIRDASATETVKTLTTHYTVTGAGSASGGTIVFTAGNIPTATETVVIRRASPQTQAIDYIANDPFPAESHEEGLDRSMMAIQQLQEEVDRSIKLSRTNTMNSTEFTVGDTDRAGKIFGFDSNGELVVSQELGTFKGNWSASTTYSARDIVKDTSTNNIFLANTGHTSSGSQPLTTNTDSAKWDLLVDAASATTSATNAAASATAAATSATNASTSETNAATSATTATTKAGEASTSATNAETAKTAAETAQAAAEAALDNFDDRFLGAKASDPSVDNDGDALTDGALYFNTTDDVMKVYDLTNTTWRQIQLSTSDQANVNTVAADLSGSNTIGTVAGSIANVNTTATNIANINTTAGIDTEISNVSSNSSAIVAVNANETNINAVNANSTNINLVASNNTNVTNVGSNISSITTAANNLSDINAFANIYLGPSSSAPTQDPDGSALDVGDLYFDTVAGQLKVYSSTGWINAGSSINATAARFHYTATAGQTTFTGTDNNGETLAYDAGYVDIYLNGVKLVNGVDVTVTSGTSIVLASGATVSDSIDIIGYGTFDIANISASNVTSGTLNVDRLPAPTLTVKGDGSSDAAIQLNCSQNSHGVKIKSPAHSAGQSYTLILPTSVGSSGQVLASNGASTNQLSWVDAVEAKPTVADVSQTIAPATATTINITGTGFVSIPIVEFIKTDGSVTLANTVSFTNATTLSVNVTLASGNYYVRVENPDGNAGRSTNNILTASTAPSFSTAAGSLGTIAGNFSGTVATIAGSSDSAITFSETTSVLTTANCTLNSTTGVITTTDFGGASTTPTTYNFTIRITDAENQTADRNFSFTSSFGATGGGQFN
ncbi:tail fiber [uncultured Mediterranean phage uvMED]|nr:tail fiber [uncultured Mediterranean phage uvMED]